MQQFEISNYTKKQLQAYLEEHQVSLQDAMSEETRNAELAQILHSGLPTIVRKFYALSKFQAFFWEKREFLATHIAMRLGQAEKK